METKTQYWQGYSIRFVNVNGEWMAILKDICDALGLRTNDVAQRISADMLERILVEERPDIFPKVDRSNTVSTGVRYGASIHPSKVDRYTATEHKPVKVISKGDIGKDLGRKPGQNKTRWMLAVNELGIYEALFASKKLEARKFREWAMGTICKLRKIAGLEQYEVMEMTRPDIQERVDHLLDDIFWDEEKKCLMRSVTIAGGDVDQIPLE